MEVSNGCNSFVCVSLVSSIVQLHDSLNTKRSCTFQRPVSVVEMVTALVVYYRRVRFSCEFFVRKRTQCKGYSQRNVPSLRSEVFVVYSGSQLDREILWRTKSLKRRRGSGWDNSQKLVCCGFRRTGKAMGQLYQCWWRICREINVFFFQFRISDVLHFTSIRDLFTDAPSYIRLHIWRRFTVWTHVGDVHG
jgi:hypothetical protein